MSLSKSMQSEIKTLHLMDTEVHQRTSHKLLLQMPKGCLEKKAALVIMDKDPVNLDREHQYVRLKKTEEDLRDA